MLSISSRLCFTFKSESNYDKHQQVLKKEQCSVSHPTLSSDSLVRAILNLALPNCTRSSVDNDSPGNKVPSCLNKMRNRCFDLRFFQEESCWRALGLYIGYILFCAVEKIRNTIFLSFAGSDHPSEDILQALWVFHQELARWHNAPENKGLNICTH